MSRAMRRVWLGMSILLMLTGMLFSQDTADLVNLAAMDSTIIIDLKYATADNFFGDTLYSANICLLRRAVAERLIEVQRDLREQGYGLKVWDGYRPLSVQKKMWEKVPNDNYVADPKTGSNHNRAAAVDVTIVDLEGNELEMPTRFDDFSEKAGSAYPIVSEQALKHRTILQEAMCRHGFETITSEWWHFNDKDRRLYSVLDVPLDQLMNQKK
ncbi:MAG: M15 family metallopeptidase [Candidatus Zhuqueibacterota bacterium]